jgi:hypothetical protein
LRAVSCRARQKYESSRSSPLGTDEQDIFDLLKLRHLNRELLDHLTAMFPVEEAAELLRALADGLESSRRPRDD